jgi:hypothetical protein
LDQSAEWVRAVRPIEAVEQHLLSFGAWTFQLPVKSYRFGPVPPDLPDVREALASNESLLIGLLSRRISATLQG